MYKHDARQCKIFALLAHSLLENKCLTFHSICIQESCFCTLLGAVERPGVPPYPESMMAALSALSQLTPYIHYHTILIHTFPSSPATHTPVF